MADTPSPTTSSAEAGASTDVKDEPAFATVQANHRRTGFRSWAGQRLRRDLSNWRLFLVRIVTSGLAVMITVAILPGLLFSSWHTGKFLLVGLVFGILNATVKPILQFLSLRYLVATYGLVVILINAALLLLLSWILGGSLTAAGLVPLLLGGLLVGTLGLALDTLAGTTPPIVDRPRGFDEADERPASVPAPVSRTWDDTPPGTRWYETKPTASDAEDATDSPSAAPATDPPGPPTPAETGEEDQQ